VVAAPSTKRADATADHDTLRLVIGGGH
jgi:hypothetical protein